MNNFWWDLLHFTQENTIIAPLVMKGKYFASLRYLVLIPYCYTPPFAASWSKTINLFNSDNIDKKFPANTGATAEI